MFLVICHLLGTATLCFCDGTLHGTCHFICVHDDLSVCIPGCTADGLDHRGFTAQEPFFVCVQNCHQRNFRNVQSFTQQVNAYQYIKLAQAKIPDDLHTFYRINIMVQIADTDAHAFQIGGQIFRHFLCQCGDENTFVFFCTDVDF